MSLVIGIWDGDLGIAVSEGRACISDAEGNRIPFAEDRCKTKYLPDGSILGLTGDIIITEKLRAAIEAEAASHTFADLRGAIVPELFRGFRANYPDNEFGVMLIGNDRGVVRSGTWTTNGEPSLSVDGTLGTTTLGCADDTHDEAARAVLHYLVNERKDYVDLGSAAEALKHIITDLAERHVEINDRLHFSFVLAPSKAPEGLLPLGNGATTQGREVIDWSRMVAQGSDKTSRHVLNSAIDVSSTAFPTSGNYAITGYGWTATTASANDVYNINGTIAVNFTNSGSSAGIVEYTPAVYVDGTLVTTVSASKFYRYCATQFSGDAFQISFYASITGLSPGSHTIQVHADSIANTTGVSMGIAGSAVCQRIY